MQRLSTLAQIFALSRSAGLWIALGFVAQDLRAAEPRETPNYAFATQLGSGIYSINDRAIHIYRFSPAFDVRKVADESWGLRLRFPLTLGFYDFKIEDVISEGLPDRVTTAALVPTLEVPLRANKTWYMIPFGGAGYGRDFSSSSWSIIYVLGVQSLAILFWGRQDVRLGVRALYSAYMDEKISLQDDYGVLETGPDVRRGLGTEIAGHELAGSIFAVNYLHIISPQMIRQIEDSLEMNASWEIGFTLGTATPWRIFGIRLPRVGLSYRFGQDRDAHRLIIGNPFPLDPPESVAGGNHAH